MWRTSMPADGAERQAFEVLVLREILPHAVGLVTGARRRIADRQRADLAPPPTGSAPAATATRRARRRCCRSRTPNRRAAAATRRRRPARADRGWRWRIRRGSADAAAAGRRIGCAAAAAIELAFEPGESGRRSVASSGRRAPGGGIVPVCSLRTTFSQSSALLGDSSARSSVSSASPAGLDPLVVAGDAVAVEHLAVGCGGGRGSDRLRPGSPLPEHSRRRKRRTSRQPARTADVSSVIRSGPSILPDSRHSCHLPFPLPFGLAGERRRRGGGESRLRGIADNGCLARAALRMFRSP